MSIALSRYCWTVCYIYNEDRNNWKTKNKLFLIIEKIRISYSTNNEKIICNFYFVSKFKICSVSNFKKLLHYKRFKESLSIFSFLETVTDYLSYNFSYTEKWNLNNFTILSFSVQCTQNVNSLTQYFNLKHGTENSFLIL